MDVKGLFEPNFKSFQLLLETSAGIEETRKGDLLPNFVIIYEDKFQSKWQKICQKFAKLFHHLMKGKKSPTCLNLEFNKFVMKNLVRRKLFKNLRTHTPTLSMTPMYFKRFYGYELTSFFQVKNRPK